MVAPLTHASALPTAIGRYRILALLGRGAFSVVYRAYDPHLDRDVALKVPNQASERFLREARAAARLRHPHIVPVYDVGTKGELRYLACRLVTGQTLEQRLQQRRLSYEQSARLIHDLADALAYAHRQGIVHRDVKPANVMIDEKGVAFLVDFGLAHLRDETQKLTHDGAILGTPAYLAPEHAAGRKSEPLPAGDQYSLGVLLFELLTGRVPFEGTPPVVLHKVVTEEPPAPSSLRGDVPLDLEMICLKALERNPRERYRDCQEMAAELRRYLEGEPIHARPLNEFQRLWRWARREPKLALGVSLAVASFLLVALVPLILVFQTRSAIADQERAAVKAREQQEWSEEEKRRAESRAAAAQQVVQKARMATEELTKQKLLADQARQEADQATETVHRTRAELEQRQNLKPHYHYVTTLIRAQAERDPTRARALLAQLIPESGAVDLRSFEWRWLYSERRKPAPQLLPKGVTNFLVHGVADDGQILLLQREKGVSFYQVDERGNATALLEQPSARMAVGAEKAAQAAALTGDGKLVLLALQQDAQPMPLALPAEKVVTFALAADGKLLATLRSSGGLDLWRVDEEKPLYSWPEMRGDERLRFSPDGRYLLVTGLRGAKLIAVETGTDAAVLPTVTQAIAAEAFSPDGKRLALSLSDGHVRTWNLDEKSEPQRLGRPPKAVCLTYTPDGKTLVTGDAEGNIHLWNVATGQEMLVLGSHGTGLVSLWFLARGTCLLSQSQDGVVKTWYEP